MDFEFNPDAIDEYPAFDPIPTSEPQQDAFNFMDNAEATNNTTTSTNPENNDDDLFGLGSPMTTQTPTNQSTTTSPTNSTQTPAPASANVKKEWMLKKEQELKVKAEQQRAQFKKNQEEGKAELLKFQQERTAKIAQKKAANRNDEQQAKQDLGVAQASSNPWVKVSSYCNLKEPDSKKVADQNNSERMRSLLIDLKNQQ